MYILIKNGRVIDKAADIDAVMYVLIRDTVIDKVAEQIEERDYTDVRVIDAGGCFVMPGFIDMHVHLRDPGFTYKETIATGSKAAAKGGFTTICPMPNTKPVTDNPEIVSDIVKRAMMESPITILPVGAVTTGQQGREVTDIKGMAESGICAISEDGKSVMNSNLYREAMKIAKECGIPVLAHCEDINLVAGGVMNMGDKSRQMGLKGISNAVEDIIAARDILLAKETGATLHLCHCSTAASVRMIKEAKEEGLPVSGEVCPHHFTLSADDIKENDGNYKMNPPLRSRQDVETLKQGLRDGIMDVISTDHAPHGSEEKARGFEGAPFGIVGLETSAALTYTELVLQGYLTPMQMVEKMSYNPARILGIDRGTLLEGKTADVVIFNPETEYVINAEEFVSKGHNTPFHGRTVKGAVEYTIHHGKVVFPFS